MVSNSQLPIQAAMRRCILDDGGIVVYYLDPSDSTKRVGGGTANLDGSDGQVMVEIPKFYYYYDYSGTTHTWKISQQPLEGFSVHPAFIKNGEIVDYRYIGAYEGVLYDVSAGRYTNGLRLEAGSATFTAATSTIERTGESHPFTLLEVGDKIVVSGTTNNNGTFTVASTGDQSITVSEALVDETAASAVIETEKDWSATGDKLSSVSGKAPINYGTRANFRQAAANRGTGWRQVDFDLISAIQLLYIVEYADWNSQAKIGSGLTNWSWATWGGYNDYNPINRTGLSNALGNATGNLTNGSGVTGSYMSYRGIENFFGHLWKWVDGININDHVPYVSNNDSDWADDTSTNYYALGVTLADASGWVSKLAHTDRGFLPVAVGGSSSTFLTDCYWQDPGWRVAMLGGSAGSGLCGGGRLLESRQFVGRSQSQRLRPPRLLNRENE